MARQSLLALYTLFLTLAAGTISATTHSARDVFETFDQVVYLLPEEDGNYWAIPNGDSEQYFGATCDPEDTACILSGADSDETTYARLLIGHDPTPDGYDNADLAGVPTGTTPGSGDQLWCPSPDHPLTMAFRARWSDAYSQSGSSDVAVGSNGFGGWNNPVQPDYSVGPTTATFFQWVDGFGLSTVVTKVIGGVTTILAFDPIPISIDMQDWTEFKIEIRRLGSGADQVKFYVMSPAGPYLPINTEVVSGGLGCLSLEIWNDIQSYDALGVTQLQNLPAGETQALDIDRYQFSQP
jgi:hypothetical protein